MNPISKTELANGLFLSCLCGSEQVLRPLRSRFCFLSCLCGSELADATCRRIAKFLSCLCGSELGLFVALGVQVFLSCLCGSELEVYPPNHLIFKEHSPSEPEHPNSWSVP